MYFFSFRIFNNLRLPWKTEFALKFFTALKYFYLSGFEEPALALKTEFVMKIFAAFDIFLHSGCLSNFCLPWKTECVLNSPYWIYFFSFRIFNNFRLPWKTEFALKMYTAFKWGFWVTCACSENRVFPEIFHCIDYSFTFRIFEQLVLALKNRVCPEFTLLTIYFLSFRILNSLRLPWKTESALEFFTVLKNFLSFEQLVLALKNRLCPEFTLLTIYFLSFRILNNALALKNRICPGIFLLKCFLSFRIFEKRDLALKTEFALNFSSRGRPPAPTPRTPLGVLGVTIGQQSHAKIDIVRFAAWHMEMINILARSWWQKKSITWRCVAVSGKNVNKRTFFSTPTLLVWPRWWPSAKIWRHIIFT